MAFRLKKIVNHVIVILLDRRVSLVIQDQENVIVNRVILDELVTCVR